MGYHHNTVTDLEQRLAKPEALSKDHEGQPYVYVEVGKWKPFHPSIKDAALRRGIRLVAKGRGVFYAYAKAAA